MKKLMKRFFNQISVCTSTTHKCLKRLDLSAKRSRQGVFITNFDIISLQISFQIIKNSKMSQNVLVCTT